MLLQDFIGPIIGSVIGSIIGSILVWLIIELIKNYKPKRKLKRNIRKLYEEFAKREIEPYKAIRMSKLIGDIGKKKVLSILKLTLMDEHKGRSTLISGDFIIQVAYTPGRNDINIKYGDLTYYYNKPDENQNFLDKFLEFYEEQCKLEKIKLKKPKQVKNKKTHLKQIKFY